MTADALTDGIARFVDRWLRALESRELAEAERLRDAGYRAVQPDGQALTREQELAMLASPSLRIDAAAAGPLAIRARRRHAVVSFDCTVEGEHEGARFRRQHRWELRLVRGGGEWRAIRSSAREAAPRRGRAARLLARAKRLLPRAGAVSGRNYLPCAGGRDFAITEAEAQPAAAGEDGLPMPPEALWLGYDYPAHGRIHVGTMLDMLAASDFALEEGGRVLDLGCGAGRMIRHLQGFAGACEIWGADISAEHIAWCRHNLSPPFHFLTNTREPHLPFADASFRLIYCGSLFTHIDELAEAWLLELNRLLAGDGRLYVTIHDEHTAALFDRPRYRASPMVREIKANRIFGKARDGFALLVAGRRADPQVFYARGYFAAMAASAGFDIVSVAPEAYFYQTAILLKPKARAAPAQ